MSVFAVLSFVLKLLAAVIVLVAASSENKEEDKGLLKGGKAGMETMSCLFLRHLRAVQSLLLFIYADSMTW